MENEHHQRDYYFDHPKFPVTFINVEGIKDAEKYLRVRLESKGDSVCLKDWHEDPEKPGKYTHCDEYESSLEDGEVLIDLLKNLGYEESALVDKKRKSYEYENFEIEIDEVANLGVFVEIELKQQVEDAKEGLKKIYKFLKMVGISEIEMQNRGYVSMIWNPDYDFSESITI